VHPSRSGPKPGAIPAIKGMMRACLRAFKLNGSVHRGFGGFHLSV
jgi:hypothetical protein